MKKIVALILSAALILCFFAGCGSSSKEVVNVYNWGEYIDESIFDEFEKETGIKVNYKTYETNEQLYSVLKAGGSEYDVIIPSDYMISRMIDEDMLEKINFDNIPNMENINDEYINLNYDPTGEYSVPYMSGTVGIIYNSSMIDGDITSWGALFDEEYSGQILMFDNSRDALAIALLYLGYSINTTSEAELNEAYKLLEKQKPLLQAYVMDLIFDKLESGEAAIGPYYAGDYLTMLENNPDLKFVIPSEGSNWFIDAMCIPKGAANKDNAEAFINFMCKPEISAANMDETGYTSPVTGAIDLLEFTPEEQAILNPSADILAKCEIYVNLPQNILDLYDSLWVELKS